MHSIHQAGDEPPDYRYFDLDGSHADAGYSLGLADSPFRVQPWWSRPPALRFSQHCYDLVRELHPPVIDEFNAYADAQKYNRDALWNVCCRVNLKAHVRARVLDEGEGCSTVAWHSPGGAFVGRNYDYWPMQTRRQRLRFTPNCHAHHTIGTRGGVPCGRYDGVNAHGLFVSLHVVMTDTPTIDEVRPGVPFHLVGRIALERCTRAREAAEWIAGIPHLSSLNYLVADPGEAFVVETDPRRTRAWRSEAAVTAVTNHFRHPDMRPLQGARANTNSECRMSFLLNRSGQPDLEQMQTIMADRSAPVCGLSGALTTLWSCVAELSSGQVRYAPGPPVTTAYEEIAPIKLRPAI